MIRHLFTVWGAAKTNYVREVPREIGVRILVMKGDQSGGWDRRQRGADREAETFLYHGRRRNNRPSRRQRQPFAGAGTPAGMGVFGEGTTVGRKPRYKRSLRAGGAIPHGPYILGLAYATKRRGPAKSSWDSAARDRCGWGLPIIKGLPRGDGLV